MSGGTWTLAAQVWASSPAHLDRVPPTLWVAELCHWLDNGDFWKVSCLEKATSAASQEVCPLQGTLYEETPWCPPSFPQQAPTVVIFQT